MGSVSPAVLRWNSRLGGIGAPAVGKLERDGSVGCGLGVDGDADRESTAIERQDAGLRVDADADGGGDDERFVESAGAGDALEGLHDFSDANGKTVEGEFGPRIKRVGSEGALAPLRIGDVVVGLLGVGAGEEGAVGAALSAAWTVKTGSVTGAAGSLAALIAALPFLAGAALEPDLFEARFFSGLGGVDVDAELFAGRDAGGSFIGGGTAEACGLCVGFVGAEGDEVEAEDVGERGLKLVDLGIEFEEEAGLRLRVEIAGGNFFAKIEGLTVDGREGFGDRKAGVAGALRLELLEGGVDLMEARPRATRARAL